MSKVKSYAALQADKPLHPHDINRRDINPDDVNIDTVSYTHLTLPTTPYV